RTSPTGSNPRVRYISFGVSNRSAVNKTHSQRAVAARRHASKIIVRAIPRRRKSGWVATSSIQAKGPRAHTLIVPAGVPFRYATYGCMPTRRAVERRGEVGQDLRGALVRKRGHPAEVRLVDRRESFVAVDRTPGGRDPRGGLLAPDPKELEDRAEQFVGVHGGLEGGRRNEPCGLTPRYFRPPRRTPLYHGPMHIIEARNRHASGT